MKCYVLELKEVHGTMAHTDGELATCQFVSATHDVLTYAAPRKGAYIHAVAVEAESIEDAIPLALSKFNETSGDSSNES